ncbi:MULTISPECIES: alkaline phosphatase family protein [Sorangium]|uniref:PhlC1 protein n=1 Tax=Sorangium cellulosum (strain So ce56) TaxID=448385 RepID=A9ERS6_SORC5|nr:alkaline phosphatase family protein [Sorangium cellulosum]CAN97323.1 phlC1 [Sorangium cellulosum So ce56]
MALKNVQHFFVLMLENRSFDHLFGLSDIAGTSATTGEKVGIEGLSDKTLFLKNSSGESVQIDKNSLLARNRLRRDVPHEFEDVKRQLCGPRHDGPYSDESITMGGFIADRGGEDPDMEDAVRCVGPGHLRVFNALASEFVICDHWFSSVPGPTFPNRMFAHAATSGGIAGSPTTWQIVRHTVDGYDFRNGHIFGRLRQKGIPWEIFVHDRIENMSVLLDGISAAGVKEFSQFTWELNQDPFRPQYIFIEPRYDAIVGHYSRGNSMHPIGDMVKAELLVKDVYETIRAVPRVWERSALIVVFDEHGGFFDHVRPPKAPAPGDGSSNSAFDFERLGPRVPALIISPLIPRNLVDSRVYDHTSILRTVAQRFDLPPLTKRDASANSLEHLFSLDSARRDTPKRLPDPAWPPELVSRSFQRAIPEMAGDPTLLGASAGPFVLAAAAVKAELAGPDAWGAITDEVRALDGRSQEKIVDFVTGVREEAAATADARAPRAPRAPRSRDAGLGGMGEVSMFAPRSEILTPSDEVEERHAEAWRVGISRAELREIERSREEASKAGANPAAESSGNGDQGTSAAAGPSGDFPV